MNNIPLVPINVICVTFYMVKTISRILSRKKAGTLLLKPNVANEATNPKTIVTTKVSTPIKPTPATPIKKVKEKDNDKKPSYDGKNWSEMVKSLKPKVSPTNFPAGYVWTTKFCDISYVVDIGYKGYSTTVSKFWDCVPSCPPCLDANDYDFMYKSEYYYVDYDEQGNKFWSYSVASYEGNPIQWAHKFAEGTTCSFSDGSTWVSRRYDDGSAHWDFVSDDE